MLFPLYDHNPIKRFPFFTLLLIATNVLVQWQMTRMSQVDAVRTICRYGFISNRLTKLDSNQDIVVSIDVPVGFRQGRPAQQMQVNEKLSTDSSDVFLTLITAMFLHGGWLHLISNIWFLWVFGNNIEDRLGHLVFIAFYLLGGILATLAQWAIDPASQVPMVGASGAVAATLGAYALTYPWAKVRTLVFIGLPLLLDLPALLVLGAWLIGETVMGVVAVQNQLMVGVAHWAHIGGFVAGVVMMPLLSIGKEPPGEDWQKEANSQFDYDDPRATEDRRDAKQEPRPDAEGFVDPRFRQ